MMVRRGLRNRPYGSLEVLQRVPTERPAMTDGSEPVLAYPMLPPAAVRAARMNEGPSRP